MVIIDPLFGAPVKAVLGRFSLKKSAPLMVIAAALLLVYAPSAFGSSNGMNKENSLYPADFDKDGCTSCHGIAHEWTATEDKISYSIVDAEGVPLTSGQYHHGDTYTITITLMDELNPDEGNKAGFYLEATAGEFAAVSANVAITSGGLEASHTDASTSEWVIDWTAPDEGAVAFELLVNDVDGDGSPNEEDVVYRKYFALTDEEGAQLGAVEEHEVHFGVSLPQYWLGLIALASMTFVMIFAFVYLKFVSPHNTDAKDR